MRKYFRFLYKFAFPDITVKHCSQTLYESLFGELYLYSKCNDGSIARLKNLIGIVKRVQRESGGFDIGYTFYYGRMHIKGQPTSPECLMFVAVRRYLDEVDPSDVDCKDILKRGLAWIVNNIKATKFGTAIPYSPESDPSIVVWNGISFAAAGLAACNMNNDDSINAIIDELNKTLFDQLEYCGQDAAFLYYNVPDHTKDAEFNKKIDYYHLAQQAECHYYCHGYSQNEISLDIANLLTEYLLRVSPDSPPLQYVNVRQFGGKIHLWGYASVIKAFCLRYQICQDERFIKEASRVAKWIIDNAWNGTYFYPILNSDGSRFVSNYYPRSDAWVVASLSELIAVKHDAGQLNIIESALKKLSACDYTGRENHASTVYRVMQRRILRKMKVVT